MFAMVTSHKPNQWLVRTLYFLPRSIARDVAIGSSIAQLMVSVVVSIRRRKMFAEVRKMFLYARDAEQEVRERRASRNFCTYFMFV